MENQNTIDTLSRMLEGYGYKRNFETLEEAKTKAFPWARNYVEEPIEAEMCEELFTALVSSDKRIAFRAFIQATQSYQRAKDAQLYTAHMFDMWVTTQIHIEKTLGIFG